MLFRYLLLTAVLQMPIEIFAQAKLVPQAIEIKFDDCTCNSQEESKLFKNYFGLSTHITDAFTHHGCYEKNELVCARAYYTDESGKCNLVGLAIFRKDGSGLYVEYLCVDKSCTNCGVGRKIIAAIANRYQPKHIRLYSLGSALGFYRKIGFVPDSNNSTSQNLIKRIYPLVGQQSQQLNTYPALHSA